MVLTSLYFALPKSLISSLARLPTCIGAVRSTNFRNDDTGLSSRCVLRRVVRADAREGQLCVMAEELSFCGNGQARCLAQVPVVNVGWCKSEVEAAKKKDLE